MRTSTIEMDITQGVNASCLNEEDWSERDQVFAEQVKDQHAQEEDYQDYKRDLQIFLILHGLIKIVIYKLYIKTLNRRNKSTRYLFKWRL